MDKSNIIISIIIVLCVAAAVAAYGLTNSNNPIFSDLSSMSANPTGHGPGNNSTHGNHSGMSVNSGGSGGSGSGSGSSDSGSGSGSGGSGGGSDGGSGGGSDSGGDSSSIISAIQSDAWSHIEQSGCYPGTPQKSGSHYYVTIYNADGEGVDTLEYSSSGEYLGRG